LIKDNADSISELIFNATEVMMEEMDVDNKIPEVQGKGIGKIFLMLLILSLLGHKAMQFGILILYMSCLSIFCKYLRNSLQKVVQVEIQKSKYSKCIFAGYMSQKTTINSLKGTRIP
jgi:hypothetical protein